MQFFSQLQELTLCIVSVFGNKNRKTVLKMLAENVTALLKILTKISTKSNVLKIEEFNPNYGPQVFHALISMIKSQKRLRQFHLKGINTPKEFHGIVSALESQKQSLREVLIEDCDYNVEFKTLMNCENLEIIRIRYCNDEKILKITKTLNCKLTTLEIINLDCEIDASNIVLILEKSGALLQRLKIEVKMISEQSLLLETLKSFCPNILYLNISDIEFSIQLLDLIGNLKKLLFLTLGWCDDIIEEEVIQFANALPFTLQYLDLDTRSLKSKFDILFNHCNAPLKTIIINHYCQENDFKALTEFCIRKRTLKYLGVRLHTSDVYERMKGYVTVVHFRHVIVDC
ncbi:hypothetical protein F8M41_024712 [Gigaspora margarita]|uniref:Uncharacterized protein n=1 Tax=Gigaspora margarita TaxID=4874 RepID=A0A8H4AAQ6_GIGMA|nr:hypothetical protein F8M41_024712 [Gigaspora margarita]